MNVWLGVLCVNLAKKVKWIKTIHYMCNSSVEVLVMATRKKLLLCPLFNILMSCSTRTLICYDSV